MVVNYRHSFLIIPFLFSVFLLFPEETINQDKAFANMNFKVYIKTNVPYSRDLNVEYNLPEESELIQIRDPYLRSYDGLTDNEGEYVYEDLTEIVLSFYSSAGDIFYCRNLRLFREKFELILPDFPVIVFNQDERNIEYPIELYWSSFKEKIYSGETLPLVLNIRYMENLEFPEQITMAKPNMGNLEQVELSGSVESFPMRGSQIYAYPLESWYYTASESGHVSIKGGSVDIKGLKRTIPALEFDVLPLPEELKYSGAIGNFSLQTILSQKSLKEGDMVSLIMRIEGVGNLPYLNLPKITSTGFDLISTKEKEEIHPGEKGYSGYIEKEYRYQAGQNGLGELKVDSFSWLNRATQQIEREKETQYLFNIEEQNNPIDNSIRLMTVSEIDKLIMKEWVHKSSLWLLILPGFIFFVIKLFLLNKKNDNSILLMALLIPLLFSFTLNESQIHLLQEGERLVNEGDYDRALDLYKSLYREKPSAAYQYNMAIVNHFKGDLVECELLLRSALLTMKDYSVFQKNLKMIEELYGLNDQYTRHGVINSLQLKFFLILLLNLLFILLSQYIKKKRTLLLFMNFMLLGLIFSSALALVLMEWGYNRPQGVVMDQGGELKRIPEETANEWLNLKAGTTLQVKIEKSGYYFIKTGYGLEGWFPVKDLILVEKGYY